MTTLSPCLADGGGGGRGSSSEPFADIGARLPVDSLAYRSRPPFLSVVERGGPSCLEGPSFAFCCAASLALLARSWSRSDAAFKTRGCLINATLPLVPLLRRDAGGRSVAGVSEVTDFNSQALLVSVVVLCPSSSSMNAAIRPSAFTARPLAFSASSVSSCGSSAG